MPDTVYPDELNDAYDIRETIGSGKLCHASWVDLKFTAVYVNIELHYKHTLLCTQSNQTMFEDIQDNTGLLLVNLVAFILRNSVLACSLRDMIKACINV
jgi:hypothetical protein